MADSQAHKGLYHTRLPINMDCEKASLNFQLNSLVSCAKYVVAFEHILVSRILARDRFFPLCSSFIPLSLVPLSARTVSLTEKTHRDVGCVSVVVIAKYISFWIRLESLRFIYAISSQSLLRRTSLSTYKKQFINSSFLGIVASWLFLYRRRRRRSSHTTLMSSLRHSTLGAQD